jgi:hypothetical protein
MRKRTREEIEIEMGFIAEPQIRRFCGPLFFTTSVESALGNITNNGSYGLIDTGIKKLLITCHHVWKGFQDERDKEPELRMCVCLDNRNPTIFDDNTLVDADKGTDLAAFDMGPYVSKCVSLEFFKLYENPVPRVKKGDVLCFVGFPGHQRKVVDSRLGVGRQCIGVRISGVDGFQLQSKFTTLRWTNDQFGGMSGCPCFVVKPDRAVKLAGFATSVWMNHLLFTHAGQINPDGTIKK